MLDQTEKKAKISLKIEELLQKGNGELLIKIANHQIVDMYITDHERWKMEPLDKRYVAVLM